MTANAARLEAIVAALPDALIVTDHTGHIRSLNARAEAMFGCAEDEVADTPIAGLLSHGDSASEDWFDSLERTTERHANGLGAVLIARRNGSSFPVAVSLGGAHGHERFFFLRDLTERQQAELRLRNLQNELARVSGRAALGTVATTIAHQLNPPLTATVNYVEGVQIMLEAAEPDIAAARAALGEAATQAFRAGEIVQRLRDAVSLSGPEHRIENLPQLIEDASGLALAALGSGDRGVDVHISLDRAAETVLADGIQVQQVLLSLIRNALEAMESSSTQELEITSRQEAGGYVRLTVADSGPGIGEEVSARLFQPFTSTKADGMGLGLSVCRSIVEAHGGRIWTEPSSLGGTAFHFTLVDADPCDGRDG
jgi:two-component system, LuxR family, sensor kinase FixL